MTKIAIIGATHAGLALARILQVNGYLCDVYDFGEKPEKDPNYPRETHEPVIFHEGSGLEALRQCKLNGYLYNPAGLKFHLWNKDDKNIIKTTGTRILHESLQRVLVRHITSARWEQEIVGISEQFRGMRTIYFSNRSPENYHLIIMAAYPYDISPLPMDEGMEEGDGVQEGDGDGDGDEEDGDEEDGDEKGEGDDETVDEDYEEGHLQENNREKTRFWGPRPSRLWSPAHAVYSGITQTTLLINSIELKDQEPKWAYLLKRGVRIVLGKDSVIHIQPMSSRLLAIRLHVREQATLTNSPPHQRKLDLRRGYHSEKNMAEFVLWMRKSSILGEYNQNLRELLFYAANTKSTKIETYDMYIPPIELPNWTHKPGFTILGPSVRVMIEPLDPYAVDSTLDDAYKLADFILHGVEMGSRGITRCRIEWPARFNHDLRQYEAEYLARVKADNSRIWISLRQLLAGKHKAYKDHLQRVPYTPDVSNLILALEFAAEMEG